MKATRSAIHVALGLLAVLVVQGGAIRHANAQQSSIELDGEKVVCCNPELEGFSSRILAELSEWIRDRRVPIYSVLVSRNGRLAFELYTTSLTRDAAHYQMSVTKSLVSALIGIAIDRQLIGGPDTPITELLPRHLFATDADLARFSAVTIRDVLGMSALDALDPPSLTNA